jgi:two-component sensor histidine kinase
MGETSSARTADSGSGDDVSLSDKPLFRLQKTLFIRFRWASLASAVALYAAVVLLTAGKLSISSNYFVIAPVTVAAFCFGVPGGFVSGLLALPANLLLFYVLGHPEYSPANKIVAELAGLVVGLLFGNLAEYFRALEGEIRRRQASEEALRAALSGKELLLRELQHRVKNNLSVIKGLVQLQRNRSGDPSFRKAADELIGRIFAISLVHDQLGYDPQLATVDLSEFLRALVGNVAGSLGLEESRISLELETEGRSLQVEAATSLGLIVNEVLTNSIKHAASERAGNPSIRLSLRVEGNDFVLVVSDDGKSPSSERVKEAGAGLGLKLVRALARNLGGRASLDLGEGLAGARFELRFPATFMELV